MSYKFKNDAQTTLSGDITNSATSLVVASATNFPTSGDFMLKIDTEYIKATAVSSNTFTVVRAQEGSTGAAHVDGATVTLVITEGTLESLLQMPSTGATLVNTFAPASFVSGGSVTITAPTAGNLLIAFVAANQFTVTSITQTNVVWTKVGAATYLSGNYANASVWQGVVSASAGTSVTVTLNGSNTQYVTIHEYSGVTSAVEWTGTGYSASIVDVLPVWGTVLGLSYFALGGRTIAFIQARGGTPTINPTGKWTLYGSMPYTSSGVGILAIAYNEGSIGASAEFRGMTDNFVAFLVHLI